MTPPGGQREPKYLDMGEIVKKLFFPLSLALGSPTPQDCTTWSSAKREALLQLQPRKINKKGKGTADVQDQGSTDEVSF